MTWRRTKGYHWKEVVTLLVISVEQVSSHTRSTRNRPPWLPWSNPSTLLTCIWREPYLMRNIYEQYEIIVGVKSSSCNFESLHFLKRVPVYRAFIISTLRCPRSVLRSTPHSPQRKTHLSLIHGIMLILSIYCDMHRNNEKDRWR